MGVETKNLGFGFGSHIDNKNTQRRFKTNIKELTRTQAIIFKVLLGDLMGLKGALFQNPPMRFKK